MAQNQDTYIARLLVELQDEGALAKFKERVEDVGAEVESVSRKASQWKSVFSGADLSSPVRNLRRAIVQSDAAMDDLVQNSVSMQKAITQRYGAITAEIQDVTAANVRMGNAAQKAGYKAQESQIKTSQTSQNLLRIMQDAQFGMLGMANNIQALGESLGRQASKQKSYFDVFKAGVKDLITGPFAIPALITLLTVLPQIDYGAMVQGMKDFGMEVADVVGLLQEGRTELNDFAAAVRDLEEPENYEDIAKSLSNLDGEELEKARKNVKERAQLILNLRKDLFESLQEAREQVNQPGLATEAARRLRPLEERIEQATFKLQAQQKILRAINAEETKRENTVQRLSKIIGEEQARYLMGLTEKTEGAKEETEEYNRVLERRFSLRRRALELEARPENLQQQLDQTLLKFDERRAEIQDEFADKRRKVREQAEEGLLSQQEEQQKINELRRRENVLLTELNAVQERTLELRRDERFAALMERQMDRARTIMENQQDLVEDTVSKFNQFTEKRLKDAREELQVQKSLIQLKERQLQVEKELGQFDVSETVAPDVGGPQGGSLEFQQDMLKRQKNLQKRRIDAQVDFLKRKRALGFDLTQREIAVIENAEKRKAQIEKRYQQKRFQQQIKHYRKMAGAVESSPVGNAVSGLITDLGAMWQAHYEDKLNWQKKSMSERAVMIGQMGGQILGRMSSIAEKSFASWKSARQQDLKDEGKTAEERRKILKKEGKKRFAIMKAIKITEASVNTATGVTRALAELPPPASYVAAAATAAAGIFRIKQIAGMSIGDRLGGAGGGGGGQASVSTGSFKQLNPTRNARRVSGFGTNMQQNRNTNQQQNFDKIDQAADKIGNAAENMEVKYDDKTAEDITNRGNQRSKNLNK